jgi:hypothetical protein
MIFIEFERLYGTDDADGEEGVGEFHTRSVFFVLDKVSHVTVNHSGRTVVFCDGRGFLVKGTVTEAVAKLSGARN